MPDDTVLLPLTILIVDDEEPIRELLQWMLEEAGHVIHLAADGRQALSFLRSHGPVDVVLSDINMPYMDGVELERQVRASWPNQPILLISGRPPPPSIGHFLPKPFRWDTLASAITAIVRGDERRIERCA